ncbi:MAG: Gfo/Idh/MocA family oxidoreductase [Herpetosiphon sp.]
MAERNKRVGVALIGTGMIALANHLPGFSLCPEAQVVALCDSDRGVLERATHETGIRHISSDYHEVLGWPEVDAVVVATPNNTHAPIVLAAIAAGKHVLCEKPLALDLEESRRMLEAAESAGVRHMTAFTYRFVPAMRYMAQLVSEGAIGQPYHFRAQRFQDWGTRPLGWRQQRALAGSGELGDMLSHRIDYGHLMCGPIRRLVANTRCFVPDRDGQPADVEDYVAVLADFTNGATGVWESSKLATGRGEGGQSQDYCEVNGSEGTLVYYLREPHRLMVARAGEHELRPVDVPEEFLRWPGSTRDPHAPDPVRHFRYDQDVEFIRAIVEGRPCRPSFYDGVVVQAVMDAALRSAAEKRWVDVEHPRKDGRKDAQ